VHTDRDGATTVTADPTDEHKRILLLISDGGNRRVLEAWLASHDRYQQVDDAVDISGTAFDCCLCDRGMLFEHRGDLLERKENEQVILPYLLLVPESAHRETRDRLRSEHPALWDAVDGLIDMPVAEERLTERVETVLRLRDQSLLVYEQREQLRETQDQLDVLNRMLRHDIRNDIEIVLTWAALLETEVTPAGREYLERIQRAGNHVSELTAVVRDLTEAIHGDGTLDLEATSLERVLTEELEKRRETFQHAEITMPEPPEPGTYVLANELLSSVFRNLLTNAVQHNDSERPTVTVTVEDGDDHVRVDVVDNGPGIPEEVRESLFGEGEKGLESDGTGIGLFLVRSLVESYGGNVRVEDRSGGDDGSGETGTVFVVELRRATEPVEDADLWD